MLTGYVKRGPDEIGPVEGITVAELIHKLGLPVDLVAFVMVNGQQEQKTYRIRPGDIVKLLPFVGGG